MLRIFSSKIFRDYFDEYVLPMWAFEEFDNNIESRINTDSSTYKFCLPVSIGDFPETNVPACFSNDIEELKKFVEVQTKTNHRKAFIISDFLVSDLSKICFSGIISAYSKKGICNFFDKSTTISMTLKNPILTYGQEGISPRDLPADIELTYDHISNASCAFPKINIKSENFDLEQYKNIIYQAYMASTKIHEAAEKYDGSEYKVYALFFVDDNYRIKLYEIIGEESFLGKAIKDKDMIRKELDFVKLPNNASKKKCLCKK